MDTFRRRLSYHENEVINQYRLGEDRIHAVFSCWHFPFHNPYMLDSAAGILSSLSSQSRLSGISQIGDISDMHSISRHSKGKIKINIDLDEEYRQTNDCLDILDQASNVSDKHYFWGNHEDWYSQAMSETDMRKLGRGVVKSPTEALYLKERGYTVQENWKTASIELGDLLVIHGEFHGKSAGKDHLHTFNRSVMFGHTHRMGVYHHGSISAYNIGWGGDSNSPAFGYASRAMKEAWRNGFALVHVDKSGLAHVQQLSLINNKIYFDGRKY